VCTPEQAYRGFMATDMDVLVLENHVLLKHAQPAESGLDRAQHLANFALD
jgi:carbamoyltransferase